MNVCGEDRPPASQTSWRATPDIRALEAAILLVEWDRTAIGEGWPADSLVSEMASTTHLLILCLDAGYRLLGGPKYTKNCSFLCNRAALWTKASNACTGQSKLFLTFSAFWKGGGPKACSTSASKYHGVNEIPGDLSPMTFHPNECGKHLWPPDKPLKWMGLAQQWTALAETPALYQLGS